MRPITALRLPAGLPRLRWISEQLWSIEHAFERARAQAKPEEDTRVRIFFILAAFGFAFGAVSLGATRAALAPGADETAALPAPVASRADLVDRNGRLLASNLVHYGLYIDPEEVWDVAQARRALLAADPAINPQRLERALTGEHRSYVLGGLTPEERDRIHALALPGVSFEEEDRRVYPLGSTAAHLLGFVDGGGRGIAGVERAFDRDIQQDGRAGAPVQLSIDLRVQSALEDELFRGRGGPRHRRAHRRDPRHGELADLRPERSRRRKRPGPPRSGRSGGLRNGVDLQGLHHGHRARYGFRVASDQHRRVAAPAPGLPRYPRRSR
jgi:hypothetical protein